MSAVSYQERAQEALRRIDDQGPTLVDIATEWRKMAEPLAREILSRIRQRRYPQLRVDSVIVTIISHCEWEILHTYLRAQSRTGLVKYHTYWRPENEKLLYVEENRVTYGE